MRWVIKVTRSINQFRITLPGGFCKAHDIDDSDYIVIDDRDRDNITIGRLKHGSEEKAKREGRQDSAHR